LDSDVPVKIIYVHEKLLQMNLILDLLLPKWMLSCLYKSLEKRLIMLTPLPKKPALHSGLIDDAIKMAQ
jgi:hypothetical protein